MAYEYINLRQWPQWLEQASGWFSEKWGIPRQAYRQSMEESLLGTAPVPQWYLAVQGEQIVGGLGVIENDFHPRKDLRPNICAVYTHPQHRCQGIARNLLRLACRELKAQGIDTVYLLTDHVGFYERYGWEFIGMVQGDGDEALSRMYRHRM